MTWVCLGLVYVRQSIDTTFINAVCTTSNSKFVMKHCDQTLPIQAML